VACKVPFPTSRRSRHRRILHSPDGSCQGSALHASDDLGCSVILARAGENAPSLGFAKVAQIQATIASARAGADAEGASAIAADPSK
jgi:hypothetical protein